MFTKVNKEVQWLNTALSGLTIFYIDINTKY